MNKKLVGILTTSLLTLTLFPVHSQADNRPTVAVLDTALDTSIPLISSHLAGEVCIIDWNSCPNGKTFMEGPGSSSMPLNFMSKNGFEHGTQMVSALIKTNPDINIVFIRIIGATFTGIRQTAGESTLINALDWIYKNKDKYNIKSVAMSQGHHNLLLGANYCPNTPNTTLKINTLLDAGIPIFLPAGNTRDLNRVDWPSCIPSAITVSASAYGDGPALYTNYDANLTDIFVRGDMSVMWPGGNKTNEVGTSISVQVAAAAYMALLQKYPTYTTQQLLSLLKTKTIPVVSKTIKGQIIDIGGVLNA